MSLDQEWLQFLENEETIKDFPNTNTCSKNNITNLNTDVITSENDDNLSIDDNVIPECDELSISTNTKVLFLNQEIDIYNIFWSIPISNYQTPNTCVIKKQIKIVNHSNEEYEEYKKKLTNIPHYKEVIIKQINNPEARRNKFKDERKLTVGVSKKDILTSKMKTKNAFYNCFAITLRLLTNEYHEIHVKVFNTGKLEIPGIVNSSILENVKSVLLQILSPLLPTIVDFVETSEDNNVLINSNFNCGFHVQRDALHHLLKTKYNIETSFDPCSYPGVKSKFYYNLQLPEDEQSGRIENIDRIMKRSELEDSKKYCEVSFMVFRTGSCLIVGNCNEKILYKVYHFIRDVLQAEYKNIRVPNEGKFTKEKVEKTKKIKYTLDYSYYQSIINLMKN